MLKGIFTLRNFLKSLMRAFIFVVAFFLLKLLLYYVGWEDEKGFNIIGFTIYFTGIFLMYFIFDGRDYSWRDVVKFKKINNN
jgi:hypothetical protein